jgi:hypothetical protein
MIVIKRIVQLGELSDYQHVNLAGCFNVRGELLLYA